MLRQIVCQACVTSVGSLAVEGVQLIVRALPSFSEHREPFSRRSEEMLIIVEPYGLRFEGKSGDRKLGHMEFLAVVLEGDVSQFLQSCLARRIESYRPCLRFEKSFD